MVNNEGVVMAARVIKDGMVSLSDGLQAIAKSLDHLARAYAQANPPEDHK